MAESINNPKGVSIIDRVFGFNHNRMLYVSIIVVARQHIVRVGMFVILTWIYSMCGVIPSSFQWYRSYHVQ